MIVSVIALDEIIHAHGIPRPQSSRAMSVNRLMLSYWVVLWVASRPANSFPCLRHMCRWYCVWMMRTKVFVSNPEPCGGGDFLGISST